MKKKLWKQSVLAIMLAVILCVGLIPAGGVGNVQAMAEETEVALVNGDFETDIWAAEENGWSVVTDSWDNTTITNTDTNGCIGELNFWKQDAGTITLTQTVSGLVAGTYQMSADVRGASANLAFVFDGTAESTVTAIASDSNVQAASGQFTLAADADVTVGFTLTLDAGGWGYVDNISLKKTADDGDGGNGGDSGDATQEGYQVAVTPSEVSATAGDTVNLAATVTDNGTAITDLSAAGLCLWWWTDVWADGHTDGNNDAVYSDSTSGTAITQDVTVPSAGTYYIVAELQQTDGTSLIKTVIPITVSAADTGEENPDDTAVAGDLNIKKIENLPEDFIMGMDISSVISEFKSGVTYKDEAGNTIDNVTDFCKLLAANGITHIRVRVWNDPHDGNGNGYGGGNNDIATAVEIANGCRAAGLKMLIDFHCSDFWADPAKQQAPKAWSGYTLAEKQTAVNSFIGDALNQIDPNKDTVAMVQVGNETTGSFVGESDVAAMCSLFSAGSQAVRAYNPNVKVVIHVTNPEKGMVTTWAANLSSNSVDYDIIATSYYPYWHGSLANLKSEFEKVRGAYGKDVMVAETSYAYTLEDTDGHDNTVRTGNNDSGSNLSEPFSVQGQANAVRNLMDTVNQAGGLGVFYWEPAWITVGDTTGLTDSAYDEQVAANRAKWESCGSGWAASYSAEYDPDDAGKWFGGSAVDGEAVFYPDGTPTAALHVWNYVKTGAVNTSVSVDHIAKCTETTEQNGTYTLPSTVTVSYNTGDKEESVSWDDTDVKNINTKKTGTYTVKGTVTFSQNITSGSYSGKITGETTYVLTVIAPNLITDADDAGLEKGDNFIVEGTGISPIPYTQGDAKDGSGCMHWWNASAAQGTVTYDKNIALEAGSYVWEVQAQGYAGDKVTLRILDAADRVLFTGDAAELFGWNVWETAAVAFELEKAEEIRLQIVVDMQDGGWGTADALYLYSKSADTPDMPDTPDTPEDSSLDVEITSKIGEGAPKMVIASPSAETLAKLVFTAQEQQEIAAGKKAVVYLTADEISQSVSEAEKTLIGGVSQGYQIGSYLDLNLFKQIGEATEQRVSELASPIGISITLPTSLCNTDSSKERTYKIVRIHEGAATLLDAEYDAAANQLTFETDAFSTYAIVYRDKTVTGTETEQGASSEAEETQIQGQVSAQKTAMRSPETGETAAIPVAIVMMIISGAAAAVMLAKTRRNCVK